MLLGIDIGTTKVACIVLENGKPIVVASNNHNAYICFDELRAEQDADKIINETIKCIESVGIEVIRKITHIGISCQMHGLLLIDKGGKAISPLFTWQDKRVSPDECAYLSQISGSPVYSGYGCATLYSLIKNQQIPPKAECAVTIGDYLNIRLFNANPAIDPANAASWGFYDPYHQRWNLAALKSAGIPENLMPEIYSFNTDICKRNNYIFDSNISVSVATGDNQASIAAGIYDIESEIYLTIGTGGQLSVISKEYPHHLPESCEVRPFPGNKYLICCATLNGGAAWQWLADIIKNSTGDSHNIYELMNRQGLLSECKMEISPLVFGERYDTDKKITFNDIPTDLNIGDLSAGFARGIMKNIHDMMPEYYFKNKNIIIASGNAMRKNPLLVLAATEIFGMPVKISEINEEAAVGAAIFYQLSL
jgi:sedoheptulokinase